MTIAYLFFVSTRRTNISKGEAKEPQTPDRDNYWVSTRFIAQLRTRHIDTESAVEVLRQEYHDEGVASTIQMLENLYEADPAQYSFLPNELLPICDELILAGKAEDADRFHQALLDTLPEKMRITLGYALICCMDGRMDKGKYLLRELGSADPTFLLEEGILSTGRFLSSVSKFEEAQEIFEYTSRIFPDY